MQKHILRDHTARTKSTVPMAIRNSDIRRNRREKLFTALLFTAAVTALLSAYGWVGQMDYEDAMRLEQTIAARSMPAYHDDAFTITRPQ